MNFTIPAPKLDPGIDAFLSTYVPNPRTLDWTKGATANGGGTGGYFYNGPIGTLLSLGVEVEQSKIDTYAERIRQNYLDRGILSDAIFGAKFDELNPIPNLWDRLHFNIKLLRDLSDQGFAWARHYAARICQSHFNQDGGFLNVFKLTPPEWSDNGRHRGVGGCIHALVDIVHVYKADGSAAALQQQALALGLLDATLTKLDSLWPLYDLGQGDGAPVSVGPHYRVFMTAHLASALKRASYLNPKARPLYLKAVAIVLAARRGVAQYAYDIACDDAGVPGPVTDPNDPQYGPETVNHGFGSVLQWFPDCLKADLDDDLPPEAAPAYAELLEQARLEKFPTKYPMTMVAQFGLLK